MTRDLTIIAAFRDEFASLRMLAEKAAAQLDGEQFFAALDGGANSVAVLMTHVGGNLRSRWTDAFTTDGEKPDRNRDGEFEPTAGETRGAVEARWAAGWEAVDGLLGSLEDGDFERPVVIRGETLTLARALTRSLGHTAGHVHQIVLLAKHWRGSSWQTLSLPRRRV
jgi:hypothetical protein